MTEPEPETDPGQGAEPPSAAYPTLVRAVETAVRKASRVRDPLERARALTGLLAAMQYEVMLVTGDRDAALAELLASQDHPSHRSLSRDMALSRQRIDQLAVHGRRGGRPRRVR